MASKIHETDTFIKNSVSDATSKLSRQDEVIASVTLMENRYFSSLYKVQTNKNKYVIKVSTTGRKIEREYNFYKTLEAASIPTLEAVFYSEEHNYLVTKYIEIKALPEFLNMRSTDYISDKFTELGSLIRRIKNIHGNEIPLDGAQIADYINERLIPLNSFSDKESSRIKDFIIECADSVDYPVHASIVSDFALGNIHVDNHGMLVIVDLGDASYGYEYDNIAYVNLQFIYGKFGFLRSNKVRYFEQFLNGYGLESINKKVLGIFLIKHLVNMIWFTEHEQKKLDKKNPINMLRYLISKKHIASYKKNIRKIIVER